MVSECQTAEDIKRLKQLVLVYVFSLRRENRVLHKRLDDRQYQSTEDMEADLKTEMKYLTDNNDPDLVSDDNFAQYNNLLHTDNTYRESEQRVTKSDVFRPGKFVTSLNSKNITNQ